MSNTINLNIAKNSETKDPFINCPEYETTNFILRLIKKEDTHDLYECYSNKNAVRLMNPDNCKNDFYYPTMELMQEAVNFWIYSYENRWFIRFTILDKSSNKAIGTIEIFGGGSGVLRVDVAEEYEKKEFLYELYHLASKEFLTLMNNEKMFTKAIPEATKRRETLIECGWKYIDTLRNYHDYYELSLQ